MSSNLSNSSLCECKWRNVLYSYIQIPFGGGAFLFNLFIVVTILRYKGLRKKYYIVGGLATADFIEGLATFIAGVWRTTSLNQGFACMCISKLSCMMLPQSWMWRFSEIVTAYMLLAVSLDRCFAVYYPAKHMKHGGQAAKYMTYSIYLAGLVNMALGWVYPILKRDVYMPAFCSSSSLFFKPYYEFNKYVGSFGSLLSVLAFGLVVLKYRKINRARVSDAKADADVERLAKYKKSQSKLTKTLAISSACTLLFDSIPRAYGIYIDVHKSANIFGENKAYLFQLTKVNAMANFFIYARRQKDIKKGVHALMKCQNLPDDPNLWQSTSRAAPHSSSKK